MSMCEHAGSAMRYGRMGLMAARMHGYSAVGSFLGLSLATAAILAAGALLVVGLTSLATSKRTEGRT